MADRVYTTDERPRDTVVVERDGDPAPRSNTGLIILAVIIALIVIFLLIGRPFGSGGGGGTPNVTAPTTSTPRQ